MTNAAIYTFFIKMNSDSKLSYYSQTSSARDFFNCRDLPKASDHFPS